MQNELLDAIKLRKFKSAIGVVRCISENIGAMYKL